MRARFVGLVLLFVVIVVACDPAGNIPFDDFSLETDTEAQSVEIVGDCQLNGQVVEGVQCVRLRISCGGLDSTQAHVRITPHVAGSVYLGTIVFGGGGNGREFVAGDVFSSDSPAGNMILELSKQGYTVVERRWQDGWFGRNSTGDGLVTPACRYASLLGWVDNQIATQSGAFCAYGNSGGASEIAYTLTRYQTEGLLDAVVLGGGPPMSRLDLGCVETTVESAWGETCSTVWSESQSSCGRRQPVCDLVKRANTSGPLEIDQAFSSVQQPSICTGQDSAFEDFLLNESVVAPSADLNYPNTHVHFIHGQEDCTEAVTLGWLYYDAIESSKSLETPAGTPHTVYETTQGATTIINAMQSYCIAP